MKWARWILLGCLLAGCNADLSVPTATPVAGKTFVPLVRLTDTPFPSETPTVTNTATFAPSATPKPSLTPLPTSENPRIAIWRLLNNNGGCRLPCFWGITPGETTVDEFHQFVNQFPKEAEGLSHEQGFYTFYYVAPLNTDAASPVIFFDDGSMIHGIGIKLETAYLSFPLTRLLSEYGMPDQVLIGDSDLFVLYEKQKIVGQYGLSSDQPGYLCLDPKYVVGIITWADGKDWLSYVNNLFGKFTDVISRPSLRPINQVVTYDMNAFFKQFSTKNRTTCMKTVGAKP